ncbi:dTDP-4-dehydrorhamnose 3,5-epimerase family protein [Aeromonas caviae]|nr:hypothetical protein MC60_006040 [Aeromonas caviae]QOK21182.1 dTDP-4-dehydrorhamnose 3,5-epimerase family protein [Aeromonas caviae]
MPSPYTQGIIRGGLEDWRTGGLEDVDPARFAHGFYVQSEWAQVLYKCTDYYAPELEASLHWSDPTLAIEWPLMDNVPLRLSDKDRHAPLWQSPHLQSPI